MLTETDLNILLRPFRMAEHEFTRGYVYISEEAITARLDEVDLSWSFVPVERMRQGDQAIIAAILTVKDVSRGNTGMQTILTSRKKGNDNVERDTEMGEAEKGATTDALKRCARLFGIGRYLLSAPKEGPGFEKWLYQLQKDYGLIPPATQNTVAAGPQTPATPQEALKALPTPPRPAAPVAAAPDATNVSNPMADAFKTLDAANVYEMYRTEADRKEAFRDDVKRLQADGKLTAKASGAEIVAAITFEQLPAMTESQVTK